MRTRWSRPAALVTAVAVAGALALVVAACGDDDGGFSAPDAHLPDVPGDTSDTAGPTSEDGVLVPPGGGSPLGWRVMNRLGEVAITDPGGAFSLPVDPDGVTVTVGVPPAARPGDTNLLLAVTARLPEYAAAPPPPLRLDARTTAIALLATHPLLLDDEPWRAGRLLERLVGHRATAALVAEVEARWADAPTPLADAAVMASWADAAAIVARELAPAWEDAIADGAVGHGGETRVRPLDASLPVLAAPRAGGAVRFTTPPARALAARVVLAPITADGDHRRTHPDGAGAPLRWRDRIDVLATRDGDASRVDLVTGAERLYRTATPEGPAWASAAAAALTAAARAEGGAVAIPDHSVWLATAVTGAVGGAEAEAAWLAAPAASWSAARLNVAAEVGRLMRWAAPTAAPCTALGVDDDPTGAATAAAVAVANGSGRLLASLTAGLAAARSACAAPGDPAAPWLVPVVERGLATLAPDDLRLVRSPDSPLPALVDGRAGFATGRLLIHRGEPLAPRVDALGGRPVGASGAAPLEVAVGDVVPIAGARLDAEGARVELTDAAGRARGAALRPADGGGLELVVPPGLAGLTRVEAVGAGGRSPGGGELLIAPRLDRLTPPLVYRGGAPVALRIEGDGFAPGGALHLGEHAIPIPDDALPEGFVALVDPADLAAGPLDVAVAAPGGGAPRATGVILEVAPAPVITSVAPTSLARGAALELLARHVGDDLDAIAVTVDDGVAIHPLPVRFATATDGAERRISTGPSPSPVAGLVTVTLTTPAGSDSVVIDVPAPPPRLERAYSYGADHPLVRAAHLDKGLRVANGALVPGGEFWRLDTGLTYAGVPYCPLEIRPASFAFGASPCNHPTGICPDNWIWDDSRDPATWIKMSRPPGRRGSGACPAQPGIASWSALAGPDQVFDTITSAGAVSLVGAIPLSGPGARLALPEARGGGLVIAAAEGGEPNDVVLDLVVREATGNVVTLQAVDGVHIERLVIEGVPGACQVGLIVNNSRNVRIDHLEVSGCGTGLWIGSSSDVRLTQPVTLFANTLGARILYSADLDLRVRVGIRPAPNEAGFALAAGQVDGVLVEGGQRVTLHAPAIVGLAGDAVRVTQSADVRVAATIGHAWRPDGGLVASAATRVGAGVRIGPGATRIRVADTAVLGAEDGVVVAGGRDLGFARLALGALPALPDGASEPEGNRGAGLRVAAAAEVDGLTLDDVLAAGNAEGGVVIAGAGAELRRVRITGLTSELTRGDAPLTTGQPELLAIADARDVRVGGLRAAAGERGLALDGVTDAVVVDARVVGASVEAVGLRDAANLVLRDLEVVGGAGAGVAIAGGDGVAVEGARVEGVGGVGFTITGPAVATARLVVLDGVTIDGAAGGAVRVDGARAPARLVALEILSGGGHAVYVGDSVGASLVGGGVDGAGASSAASAFRIAAGSGPVDVEGFTITSSPGDGVEIDGDGRLRLGASARVAGAAGHGVVVRGAARVRLEGATLADNAAGAVHVAGASGGLALVAEGLHALGAAADVVVDGCEAGEGVIDLHGGEVGDVALSACALPVHLDAAAVRGDLTLDGCGASRLRDLGVAGAVTLLGAGDHQLDGVAAGAGVHLGERRTRGARLAVSPWTAVAADDDPSRAHAPTPRVVRALAAADGRRTLEVAGAPAHGRVALGWAVAGEPGGERPFAVTTAGADGRAVFRGVPAADAGQGYAVSATLLDGSTGPWASGAVSADPSAASCLLPDRRGDAGPAGLAWLEAAGVTDAAGASLAPAGASSWSACPEAIAWTTGAAGARRVEVRDREAPSAVRPVGGGAVESYEPSLAADCAELVWVAVDAGGQADLWRAPADDPGAARRVTADDALERTPWLAADALYFARRAPGAGRFALARLPWPDATGPAEVVYDGPGDDLWPATSADGAWLAWTRCPAGESAACGLGVLARGRGAVALPQPDGACDDRRPIWFTAPDGTPMLVASRRPVDGDAFGSARLVALTRFGRATASLTDGAVPATQPGCCAPEAAASSAAGAPDQ